MGRNIKLTIFGFMLVSFAGIVRGQENLDTLWTRTIGWEGNDVFYAMAKGNDGNVLVDARIGGTHQIAFFSANGDWFHTIVLSALPNSLQFQDLRQTPEGEVELLSKNTIYHVGLDGTLLWSHVIPGEYFTEGYLPYYPYSYWLNRQDYETLKFWTDSTVAIWGQRETLDYIRNYGWSHWIYPFFKSYDRRTDSITYLTFWSAAPLGDNCFLKWNRQINQEEMALETAVVCNTTLASESLTVSSNNHTVLVVADSRNQPWMAWTGQPFIATHLFVNGHAPVIVERHDMNSPRPVTFSVDSEDNLLCMGYSSTAFPWQGMRFDIVGSESGIFGATVSVGALPNVEPKSFVLLDDNTAFTVSTILTGSTRDLLVARTDTLPSGNFAPQPSSVDLLVEGPPSWGYRIHSGSYTQNHLSFLNLCGESRGAVSGTAAGRWTYGENIYTALFSSNHSLWPNAVDDTFWLAAPECESAEVVWSMNGADGVVRGPFHPEVSVPIFEVQPFQGNITINFSVSGYTNVDSLVLWRKDVARNDSVRLYAVRGLAGHYLESDEHPPVNRQLSYYLMGRDGVGRFWAIENASDVGFIDPAIMVPDDYTFSPPYPNPFNAQTTFSYGLPYNSWISLRIFDITGRQVATILDETKDGGNYVTTFDASALASGVYFYSFRAQKFSQTGKLLLLK